MRLPTFSPTLHPSLQVLIARCSSVKGSPRRNAIAKRGWRSWSLWRGTWEVERKLWVSNFCCLLFKRPKNSTKSHQREIAWKWKKTNSILLKPVFDPYQIINVGNQWCCRIPNRLMWFVSFWNIWMGNLESKHNLVQLNSIPIETWYMWWDDSQGSSVQT